MTARVTKTILVIVLVGAGGLLGWEVWEQLQREADQARQEGSARLPVPVEVAPVEVGRITQRRTFSGSLEAHESFVVAARVAGRIERIEADLADVVKRGEVVALLDSAEYQQRVAQAQAELVVAQANEVEARGALAIADLTLQRVKALEKRGVESGSQLDLAVADQIAKKSRLEVAKAIVTRAEAALAAEKIRLGYTRVAANWRGEDEVRVVSRRWIDEGETVGANEPLLTIIRLNPIIAVVFVAERDYAGLRQGQTVTLTTDAYPGESFPGTIERVAPGFRQSTRQARVELGVQNTDQRLKPGMFVRVAMELAAADKATIVPAAAITKRDDKVGVFIVGATGLKAHWREVRVGIRQGDRIQVHGEGLEGRVVTLGQQFIDDGSAILIPDKEGAPIRKATSSG